MSQFLTIAGAPISLTGLEPLQLVPASDAQPYIQRLHPRLVALDGSPIFLVEDGSTGTSGDFVGDAVAAVQGEEHADGRIFRRLLERLSTSDHVVRIWWARNSDEDFLDVTDCHSLDTCGLGFTSKHPRLPSCACVFAWVPRNSSYARSPNEESPKRRPLSRVTPG